MKIKTDGIHHVSLRVNGLMRARKFYGDVLGFDIHELGEAIYFTVGSTFVVLWPPLPGTPSNDRVIDTRVGFDHVAFHVGDRAELHEVIEVLKKAGVPTAGIERDPVLDKDYVCFRDPDNTQWEFYHVPVARQPLYERLGGISKIAEIVDNLVERVNMDPVIQANPEIMEAHERFPKPVTKFQVALMVCEATGGPYKYVGRTLKEAHKHLNITPKQWDAFVADVAASLDMCNVSKPEKDELLVIVQSTREDCVADEYLKHSG